VGPELLQAWQGGDREAGNQLVDRHFDAITRFFRNKVCSDDDVAELVGQTFLGCTTGKDRFRGDASVRQYLYAIALAPAQRRTRCAPAWAFGFKTPHKNDLAQTSG